MAMFPCDIDSRRYPGPQRTIYPALVQRSMSWRRKLRLCKDHFEAAVLLLEKTSQLAILEEEPEGGHVCPNCLKLADGAEAQFFATVYSLGSDRVDFWAPVHDECVDPVRACWQLDPSTAV